MRKFNLLPFLALLLDKIIAFDYKKSGLTIELRGAYASNEFPLSTNHKLLEKIIPNSYIIDATISESKINLAVINLLKLSDFFQLKFDNFRGSPLQKLPNIIKNREQ